MVQRITIAPQGPEFSRLVMVAPVRLMTLAYLRVICALIAADKGAAPLVFRHRSFYSS